MALNSSLGAGEAGKAGILAPGVHCQLGKHDLTELLAHPQDPKDLWLYLS